MKFFDHESTSNAVLWALVTKHPLGEDACLLSTTADEQPLFLALRSDMKPSTIALILEMCPLSAAQLDETGMSTMSVAVKYSSYVSVLHCLYTTNPSLTRSLTAGGLFPLQFAVLMKKPKEFISALAQMDPHVMRTRTTLEMEWPLGTSVLVMALVSKCPAEVVRVLAEMCPISLLFFNAKSETALSIALWEDASVHVLQALLDVAVSDCRAALTLKSPDGETPLEQVIALRRSPSVVAVVLEATVQAVSHLHSHILHRLNSHAVAGENLFVSSGFDLQVQSSVFTAIPLCYQGEEDIAAKSIHTHVQGKSILQDCLSVVSTKSPQMKASYVWYLLYDVVMDSQFSDYGVEIMPMLLAKLATEHSTCCNEETFEWRQNLLMLAVQERASPLAIALLLKHEFVEDEVPAFVQEVDKTGSTSLHYWAWNRWSLVVNDSSIVGESYLEVGRTSLNDDFVNSEIRARPELPVFKLLVAAWPECVSLRNKQDLSFVDLLVTSNCSLSVWEEVLAHVPEALSWKKQNGDTLLHLACTHAHIPSMCEKGVISGDSSEFARTTLSTSINYTRCEIVSWLLDNVKGAAAVPNAKGQLPLHFAAEYHCDSMIVSLLIEAFPGALSHADMRGNTPLHLAVKWSGSLFSSHTSIVQVMIANMKDFTTRNDFGGGFLVCSMPETLSRRDTRNLLRINLNSAEERSRHMELSYYSVESALNNCPRREPRLDLFLLLVRLNFGALDEEQHDGRDVFHAMRDRFLKSMLTPFFRNSYVHYVLFCAACMAAITEDHSSGRRELRMCGSMVNCLCDARVAMSQAVNNVGAVILRDFSENIDKFVSLMKGLEVTIDAAEMKGKEETARLCASDLLLEEESRAKILGAKMTKDGERRKRDKERKKKGRNEAAEAVRVLEEQRLSTESVARGVRVQEGVRLRRIRAERELEEREKREAEEAVDRHEREEEERLFAGIAAERRRVAEDAETRARQVLEEAEALVQRKLDVDAKLRLRVQQEADEMKRAEDVALAAHKALLKKKKKKSKHIACHAALDAEAGARVVLPVLPPQVEWNPVLSIAFGSVAGAPGATEMESKHQEEMLALRRKIELEMLVDKECVVCFDSIRCMALAPCGHIALCQPCAEALMLQTVKLCPTCRDPVASVLRVY